MKLTPHFTLEECDPGRLGNELHIRRLTATCMLAEFLRNQLGPLRVTSGLRTAGRTAKIGGSSTSDHPKGYALDLQKLAPSLADRQPWLSALDLLYTSGLPFDQLIWYPGDNDRSNFPFAHVSLRSDGENRREYLFSPESGTYRPRSDIASYYKFLI